MRRAAIVAAVLLLLLASSILLAGCGGAGSTGVDDWGTRTVRVHNGRLVECIVWSGYQKGGIDCDWASAR